MLYCHCAEIHNFGGTGPSFSFCSGLHKLCSWFCSCHLASSLSTCLHGCMGVFSMISWLKKKKFGLGLHMILCKILTVCEGRWVQNHSPTPGCPWRTMVNKYPSSIQSCSSCLEEEMAKPGIYTDSCIVDNGLTRWSKTWKIDDKEAWGRGIRLDSLNGHIK